MKVNLHFAGEDNTVFIDLLQGGYLEYSDPKDREEIHGRMGGRQYYESRSGRTGAGYGHAVPDLIEVGRYRVDAPTANPVHGTPVYVPAYDSIYHIYMPHTNAAELGDRGVDCNYPAVLVPDDMAAYRWSTTRVMPWDDVTRPVILCHPDRVAGIVMSGADEAPESAKSTLVDELRPVPYGADRLEQVPVIRHESAAHLGRIDLRRFVHVSLTGLNPDDIQYHLVTCSVALCRVGATWYTCRYGWPADALPGVHPGADSFPAGLHIGGGYTTTGIGREAVRVVPPDGTHVEVITLWSETPMRTIPRTTFVIGK